MDDQDKLRAELNEAVEALGRIVEAFDGGHPMGCYLKAIDDARRIASKHNIDTNAAMRAAMSRWQAELMVERAGDAVADAKRNAHYNSFGQRFNRWLRA